MLVTVALRYGSIAIQFVVLAILARHLTIEDYGRYMLVLGAVWASYTLLGLGASETFVREAPKRIQSGHRDDVATLAGGTLTVALGTAALLALVGGLLLWLLGLDSRTTTLVAFILAFVIANGVVFNVAQILLGGGFQALGSFFFYPAVNVTLLVSSVPYVILAKHPSFEGVAVATSSAGLLMAAISLLLVVYRIHPVRATAATVFQLARIGIKLACARALAYVGVWLPTFLAGVILAPVDAGYLGTASRLAAAVAAMTASVRFAVRPAIVRAFDRGDHDEIKETCGRLATVIFSIACLGLAISVIAGQSIFRIAFGPKLESAAPLLTILLVGVAWEAFCGPVDEVLKMTGHENRVLSVLVIGLTSAALAMLLVASLGVSALACVQAGYSIVVFSTMAVIARRKLGIWIRPITPTSLISFFAARRKSERSLKI
jgi:O-antigen/teichoic acid export membrane protein